MERVIPSFNPTAFAQSIVELLQKRRCVSIAYHERAYFLYLCLLRPCHHRPRCSRTTETSNKFPPPHSITSSARASSIGGIARPCALAAVRLSTRSNLVGCSTGKS